ncbi:hypothetical protein AUQ37_03795 [Candidatus Methanomethylophilus sp. 1R26]|uniref:hypothetical protein n=1 Tax=Candidatus Methanomethylophilus sp. 1R26 TaxID=1769296 RepID=UPI0007378898|nr:hypothetical protein [Candidatus Methanomethylophilus sp. 1R26]KUE73115.1 hypothetical protein AUQ37_03795 [Candidatus Methanomethylophilus sp. 1R26]TQS81851.1 MAG: hypothetical protein A3Q59_04910 [Methanomethylophilus alvi]WII09055.1 hypothetical protein O8W32_07750 [Methanomassiliicoccales archaeon LGM-DZ1]
MSFLDDTKTVGTAIWAIGILEIIAAIILFVGAFVDDDMNDEVVGWVILGVGELICAIIYFAFGQQIRGGKQVHNKIIDKLEVTSGEDTSSKFGVLTQLVHVVGYTTVVIGIFYIIGSFGFDDIGGSIVTGIIDLIIGIIILWVYKKITDGNVTTFDKVMWVVLIVVFIICIISALLSMFGGDGVGLIISLIVGILNFIVYICMLVWMFDADVKAKFGM